MIEQLELLPAPTLWASEQRRRSRARKRRQECLRHLHENSLAARADERLQGALEGRREAVRAWVQAHGPCTVRQILEGLYYAGADMDLVRPRVTELLNAGALHEVGTRADHATGRPVMVVDVDLPGQIIMPFAADDAAAAGGGAPE